MRPSFHPRLVNGPFDDPGLFVPFVFEKRAFLFDIGDIHSLDARDVLKISHIFVSHTHIDHFIGFDRLLRLFLGRDKTLHIYGPAGIHRNVEGKLAGYSWNLVQNYENRFILHVSEVDASGIRTRTYHCRDRFIPKDPPAAAPFGGKILEEPSLSVSAEILDHDIPCLGFSLTEKFHVNIMKDRLAALGLPVGPWLGRFKKALFEDCGPDTEIDIPAGDARKPADTGWESLPPRLPRSPPARKSPISPTQPAPRPTGKRSSGLPPMPINCSSKPHFCRRIGTWPSKNGT